MSMSSVLPSSSQESAKIVVLVHGIFRQSKVFSKMKQRLQAEGYTVYSPDLFHRWGALGLADLAQQLASFIEQHLPADAEFDLVGLSMGGIVSRYYLQRLNGASRVRHFITIASPHLGTWLAYTFPRRTGLEMRPGSRLLKDLDQDLDRLDVEITSIWTLWDFIIVPSQHCCLPVGEVIQVPVLLHGMMAWSDRTIEVVQKRLQEPISSDITTQVS
ncbi:alpha/beta fold hydrolase [Phormidium yuhuli AB48]|uniref:Alpha/beta fold hydrolase n=1 Tax=Phormidium yuhuli AB48 TaxID=2940671 RepID=A0ABY5ATH7_9CYAN|nr:alpha/beta fold hydrolase [Phormidium yuhuli]USR92185.1 alpha/beta fold hydrolase [Phormidium yuhuli AB48]